MRANDYKVVEATTPDGLRNEVKKALNGGWELFGGVAVSHTSVHSSHVPETIYAQAMVK